MPERARPGPRGPTYTSGGEPQQTDEFGAGRPSGVASASPLVPRARREWRRAAAVVVGWTLVGAAQSAVWYVSVREPDARMSPLESAAIPMAAAWTWAALTPLVVWLTRRLAQARARSLGVVAGYAAGALVACLVLTAVRVAVRLLLGRPPIATIQFVLWLDINVATYVLVAAAVRAVDLHRGYAARMRRAIGLEAQLARARLQFLQRQLQPHFLFNALNATAELTREAPEAARRMLGHLGRLLGAALEHAGDGEVTLRAELEALEPYVEIQRTRFGDAFDFEARVAPPALDARVPSLFLQPLVENAFRHGLAGRDRGRVRVRADVSPDAGGRRLRIEVADDGPGASGAAVGAMAGTAAGTAAGAALGAARATGPGSASGRRTGIGLRNTRDRLRQIYGDDFRFELRQNPGAGTVALLDIPYRLAGAVDVEPEMRFDTAEYAAVTAAAAALAPRTAAATSRRETVAADVGGVGRAARGVPSAWARLATLWLCAAVFWTLQIWALQLVQNGRVTEWLGSRRDVLGAVEWALLTPLVLWLARRFRLTRRTWARYLPIHVAAAAVVDVAHVVGMWRAFEPVLPLVSWYSVSPLTVNFLIYAALVAWAHARDFGEWLRDRELADARLEAALARARWQALALELRPQLVLAVLAVAARLAPEDPARAERLIERLSDLLRAVLDASSDTSGAPAGGGAGGALGGTLGAAGAAPAGAQALRHELAVFGACAELLAEASGREAQVSLDADPAALDANVAPGAFGRLLDALVDALLADDGAAAEALVPAGAAAGADRVFAAAPAGVPAGAQFGTGPDPRGAAAEGAPLRLGVLARATPGGVRVTVRADAPLFARPAARGALPAFGALGGSPPAPAFPDAHTAVLDLAPDAAAGALG